MTTQERSNPNLESARASSAPKVSIAMTTYNGAKYLRAQLDSFTAQTRLPDELVVCDDGSEDGTLEILADFAASAPFSVRIEQNENNLGYAKNFEKAISLTAGEIVFLSDQDDIWLPEKLERLTHYLEDHPKCLAVGCDLMICDHEMVSSGTTQLSALLRNGGNKEMFIWGCAMALRRTMIEIMLPFPPLEIAHDNWVGWLSSALGVKDLIEEPLQLYRRHGNNASNWILSSPKRVGKIQLLRTSTGGSQLGRRRPVVCGLKAC